VAWGDAASSRSQASRGISDKGSGRHESGPRAAETWVGAATAGGGRVREGTGQVWSPRRLPTRRRARIPAPGVGRARWVVLDGFTGLLRRLLRCARRVLGRASVGDPLLDFTRP
jgi:hypothetical protein